MDEQVQFESEGGEYARPSTSERLPLITGLVIRWGLARDKQHAQYVLLGVAIGAVALAFAIPYLLGTGGGPKTPPSQNSVPMNFNHTSS